MAGVSRGEVFTGSEVRQAISRTRINRRRRAKIGTLVMLKDGYESGDRGAVSKVVLGTGLEPARLTAHAPQTCVSTNSTTRAFQLKER